MPDRFFLFGCCLLISKEYVNRETDFVIVIGQPGQFAAAFKSLLLLGFTLLFMGDPFKLLLEIKVGHRSEFDEIGSFHKIRFTPL